MILDTVMRRKLKVLCMDDTLAVAARKMRDLDRSESPLVCSIEEQEASTLTKNVIPLQALMISTLESKRVSETALVQSE
jgi:hypothetical protein